MRKIDTPALIAATVGPLMTIAGFTIAEAIWRGFDPIVHTISALAANDAPTIIFMSTIFILSGFADITVGWYAKSFGVPGRLAILFAGVATFALTLFNTPSQTSESPLHQACAIVAFSLLAFWPILAVRRGPDVPPMLRPLPGIIATIVLVSVCLWFLYTWIDPHSHIEGLTERIGVAVEGCYPMFVVWHSWFWQRKRAEL